MRDTRVFRTGMVLVLGSFCTILLEEPVQSLQMKIRFVELYGLRKVPAEAVRTAIGFREGEPVPDPWRRAQAAAEKKLEELPGVKRARLALVCCTEGDAVLFVGLEEDGARSFEYHPPPRGLASLPKGIYENYERFGGALQEAVSRGEVGDNFESGHSLSSDTVARRFQETAILHARRHLPLIRRCLRESADPAQRAAATWILGYAEDKRGIIGDLQYAIRDSDDAVRNNAARALGAISFLASRRPDLNIRIEAEPLIGMLNSVVWSDRNKSMMVLMPLTENRQPADMRSLHHGAWISLQEMAAWRSDGHAYPAFVLLGRVMGLSEEEIRVTWEGDRRSQAIDRAREFLPPSPGNHFLD